jgi:hypothetical protein
MIVGEVLSETVLPRVLDDAVLARAYGLASRHRSSASSPAR